MENDHQKIENFERFHDINRASKEIVILNNKYKEEINMDSSINKNAQASQVTLSNNKGAANTNSPKMGSRRIFTPQFKLQVLESYRNDHDCKGNQRATARKYNIHRRQIQKWLQCEPSLRSSVANINQNSVKHQFHNVSMQQQQQQQQQHQTKNVIASQSSYPSSQLHSTHLCVDSTKSSITHKNINVPSIPSCVSTSTVQETHDILDANLVAVVAAASGTIPRTNASGTSSAAVAVSSPLRPSAIISANRNTNSSISPLLHHHHHHQYGISTYSNIPSTATVPILVHHLNSSHQTPYQYPSMPYSPPAVSHHQTEKQHSTYFTPISLPTINVLSAAVAAPNPNSYISRDNEHMDKLDLFPIGPKTYPKILSDKSFLYNDNHFQVNYECHNAPRVMNTSNTLEPLIVNRFNGDSSYTTTYPFGPMDLSLRHCREAKSELVPDIKSSLLIPEIPVKQEISDNGIDVVDLTYRKRKAYNVAHSDIDYKNECPQKQQKFSNPDAVQKKSNVYNESAGGEIYSNQVTINPACPNEDEDIEIEVGMEEKFPPTSKPVKLFKPYLLDECENNDDGNCNGSNANKLRKNENNEEMKQLPNKGVNENTFPDVVKENINVCVESCTNFLVESRSESPRSACSPATMSPTNFNYPKGSPASSGYESSTSTYSDTSISSSNNNTCAYGPMYSVNLKMQAIYNESIHVLHQSKHVQRWLEKDDSNSLESNSTIALLV